MTTRCKPGDIALIIREDVGCEANIGRLVHVRGPEEINKRGQLTWLITPVDEDTLWCVGDGKGGTYVMPKGDLTVEHPDAWMTPVKQSEDNAQGRCASQGKTPAKDGSRNLPQSETECCKGQHHATLQTR
jgi:hypothetical protein